MFFYGTNRKAGDLTFQYHSRHVFFCVDQNQIDWSTIHNLQRAAAGYCFVVQDDQTNTAASHGIELSPSWEELDPFEMSFDLSLQRSE
jgi:hypothetical protein